ncbi:hypothetical protein [Qipengyuania sp.]|uniref:hypothetical protein n=1 Tax=Qipengyuania sp. TaxID=2004515 RepID=UPI003AF49826
MEIIGVIAESRRTVIDEHSHSFRWLTASLLALNGGAALAVLSNETLEGSTKFYAGLCFLAGIAFALLVAVAGQRINRRAIPKLNDQLGYWLAVSHDGMRVAAREDELNAEMKGAMKLGVISQAFGWAAGFCLIGGAAVVGAELKESVGKQAVSDGPAISALDQVSESRER